MFRFATGIKSLSNFDPTIELEEVHSAPQTRRQYFPTQPTQYLAKQGVLYNQALATAARLRGKI